MSSKPREAENTTDSKTIAINRRHFVLGALIAGLNLREIYVTLDDIFGQKNKPELLKPLTLSGVTIHPLLTEHDGSIAAEYTSFLEHTIDQFDTVLPEYLPLEYEGISDPLVKPMVELFHNANALFNRVQELCAQKNKNIWATDPAYGIPFVKFQFEDEGLVFGAQTLIGTAILRNLWGDTPTEPTTSKKLVDRIAHFVGNGRRLASLGALTGIGLTAADEGYAVQNDLRRVIVAENYIQLANAGKLPKDVLMIFPKGHWQPTDGTRGIYEYLTNDALRQTQINLYKALLSHRYPELFVARNWQSKGNKLTCVEQRSLA